MARTATSRRSRTETAEIQETTAAQAERERVLTRREGRERALAAAANGGQPVTAAELGVHIDLTEARIITLAGEGTIPKLPNGKYPIHDARVAYIRHLRKQAGKRASVATDGAALRDAKLRKIEMENAQAEAALVSAADVQAIMAEAFQKLRSEFAGLGASITRDLQLRATIDDKVNDAIDRTRRTLEAAQEAAWSDSGDNVESEEAEA